MVDTRIRNLSLGMGMPKLFAPILSAGAGGVLEQAEALCALPIDAAEWRFDACKAALCAGGSPEAAPLAELLFSLRGCLGHMPLLFTYRTDMEQSAADGCPADYVPLLRLALSCGEDCRPDMLDIEMNRGQALAAGLAQEAKAAGVLALLSCHDYQKTPAAQEMLALLLRMEDAGADAAKLAVLPQSPADTLAILSALEGAKARLSIPYAVMGMGRLGLLTRVGGGLFGSAFTFSAGVLESAPGQPPAAELRAAFDLLYKDRA